MPSTPAGPSTPGPSSSAPSGAASTSASPGAAGVSGQASPLPLWQILVCGAFIVTLSMGIRHGFGLWLQPITMERGWTREAFSLALAVQNLMWGAAGPFVGWWADRRGATPALWLGAALYAAGLAGMASSTSPALFILSTGVLIGCAQACSTYAVVYGVIGRHVSAQQRSWAMGIAAAAGSFGQFLMVPLSSALIGSVGWQGALWALSAIALLIAPLGWALRKDRPAPRPAAARPVAGAGGTRQTAGTAALASPAAAGGDPSAVAPDPNGPLHAAGALREALSHRSYQLLTAGYFVCGFQLAFIGVHLPSYLRDHQLPPQVATTALALIGLFNVLGTYTAGWVGQRWSKPWLLASIYALRAVAMLAFIAAPPTALSVSLFAAAMGALWLSTVPPTNAIVAQMLGVRHLSMLGALVFLSHQLGSFLGVWLAGRLYDATGSYQLVWWLAIALSVAAALLNLPVREHEPPAGRLARAA